MEGLKKPLIPALKASKKILTRKNTLTTAAAITTECRQVLAGLSHGRHAGKYHKLQPKLAKPYTLHYVVKLNQDLTSSFQDMGTIFIRKMRK